MKFTHWIVIKKKRPEDKWILVKTDLTKPNAKKYLKNLADKNKIKFDYMDDEVLTIKDWNYVMMPSSKSVEKYMLK